uniref:Uncharacterized protein n=1 Tax=Parascaris univalens TaxID=6257 RepID=A0A914ZX20_PARUN
MKHTAQTMVHPAETGTQKLNVSMGKGARCMHQRKWKAELSRPSKSANAKARLSDSSDDQGQVPG